MLESNWQQVDFSLKAYKPFTAEETRHAEMSLSKKTSVPRPVTLESSLELLGTFDTAQ